MKPEDLVVGKYYTLRLGRWIVSCQLHTVVEDRAIVRIDDWCRTVNASSLIAETVSPEEVAAILEKVTQETKLSLEAMLAEAQAKAYRGSPYKPEHTEPMIVKQGSHIRLGDYGT